MALVVLGALPASSRAGWMGFQNNLNVAVVVRTATVDKKGVVRPGRPLALLPREKSWDAVVQPGVRIIEIQNAQGRPLYRDQVQCGDDDLFFSIQLVGRRIVLVPIKPPDAPKPNDSR